MAINRHIGPMNIETLYISSHMGRMYIETSYISSHIVPMYTETPYNNRFTSKLMLCTGLNHDCNRSYEKNDNNDNKRWDSRSMELQLPLALVHLPYIGTHGVMVVVKEIGPMSRLQILNEAFCISQSANTLRNDINFNYSPSSYG